MLRLFDIPALVQLLHFICQTVSDFSAAVVPPMFASAPPREIMTQQSPNSWTGQPWRRFRKLYRAIHRRVS